MTALPLTFFHSPNTRSTGVRILLEELGVPYQLHVLNMKAGEQRQPKYLAINPMGKVPAVLHGDALVTEQVAVTIYLADLYPKAGLAPALDHPLRGPYLRWLAFYGSCFEPAVVDKAMKREPLPESTAPYGSYDNVIHSLDKQLSRGPWLLGDTFTAADVLWGSALRWTMMFKLVPDLPSFKALVERTANRPASLRVQQLDAELSAQHEAQVAARQQP